jgi:hypothetical protein
MNETVESYFEFAESDEIKQQLSHDLSDVHICMKSKAYKPAIILIGSLIESSLYYHIDSEDLKKKIENFEKRNIHLSDLLAWAKQFGIIDENLYKLADPIREYRNLIHPRVQIRLKTQVSENLVQIGYNVMLEIFRRINKHADALNSQKIDKIIAKIVQEVCKRKPSDADYKVYSPILEKYGIERGKLIIEKSLHISGRRKRIR